MTIETLVVVEQHKNQYYGHVKQNSPARFGPSPTKSFRGINCRTFQSGAGILPTPSNSYPSPVSNRSFNNSFPKTIPSTPNFQSPNKTTPLKTNGRSSLLPINIKNRKNVGSFNDDLFPCKNLSFSELWAGPAYSNSPAPSSVPIPKFSLRPNRTVSLELPSSGPGIKLNATAKSAPSSPTRDHSSSTRDMFASTDSATKTLRRILNLDNAD